VPVEFVSPKEKLSAKPKTKRKNGFAAISVCTANIPCMDDNFARFTHPLHVHVVRFPAIAGVLFKYADALARSRTELLIRYSCVLLLPATKTGNIKQLPVIYLVHIG
jgi:hypothetical protein